LGTSFNSTFSFDLDFLLDLDFLSSIDFSVLGFGGSKSIFPSFLNFVTLEAAVITSCSFFFLFISSNSFSFFNV